MAIFNDTTLLPITVVDKLMPSIISEVWCDPTFWCTAEWWCGKPAAGWVNSNTLPACLINNLIQPN